MYFPYFRGKQYELIAIRDSAQLMFENRIIPIIEPVRTSTSSLKKTLTALVGVGGEFILVVNPQCGDMIEQSERLFEEIQEHVEGYENFSWGFLITEENSLEEAPEGNITLIHAGNRNGRGVLEDLNDFGGNVVRHVFLEGVTSRRYRRLFTDVDRILLQDGFSIRPNREHPEVEHFSDLHLAFNDDLGMEGFGDFLIVGKRFSDGGGPAYAVAIHLTFLDPDDENDMYIKHYVSDRTESPRDPRGKFFEALAKLVADVEDSDTKIMRSQAVEEFIELQASERYPGLGYVKKLSMQHHLETLAAFLADLT